ncbi:MAG: winged helix-turn-helix domain-containing protein, partial [Burkholderiales bacterium]|nr:winged helix-turn-helix domain-containing protein [Burkholderiales bacterium]
PVEPPAVVLLPLHDAALHLAALRSGADAVLPPEASPALIEAQLARLRRGSAAAIHGPGGLQLDADSRTARIGACQLPLRPGPFRLLWTVAAEPERVFSLARLQAAVASRPGAGSGLVHAYASRVRQALRPHGLEHCLQTVHGVGYRYSAGPAPGLARPARSERGQESATPASRSRFGMPASPASFQRHHAIAPDA